MPRSLHRTATTAADLLDADRLARDFGPRSKAARQCVAALGAALQTAEGRGPGLDRWKALLGTATGHDLDRRDAASDRLAAAYDFRLTSIRPGDLLFAVHTYFATVVKLLVSRLVPAAPGDTATTLSNLPMDRRRLREALTRLEAGQTAAGRLLLRDAGENPFDWYTAAWSDELETALFSLVEPIAEWGRELTAARRGGQSPFSSPTSCGDCGSSPTKKGTVPAQSSRDLFKPLYEALVPKAVRHRLGEYYTPDWLAAHLLDAVGYEGQPGARLLDPACGSGTFLMLAIERASRAWESAHPGDASGKRRRAIAEAVVGFDLNPLAVLSARANFLLAIGAAADGIEDFEIPVYLRDAILAPNDATGPDARKFDFVVGNPPWIAWDHLPDGYRQATAPLWREYGLFSLSAADARHGGAKKDLAALMTYVAADRYLAPGGRLGFVVTQTLFQSKGAGDGFRRFRLGDGEPLGVVRVDDLSAFQPFPGAANWTAAVVLKKGAPTVYPVPYYKWEGTNGLPSPAHREAVGGKEAECEGMAPSETPRTGPSPSETPRTVACLAEPIDAGRPTSPWFIRPAGLTTPLARLVGASDYEAHLGVNTGGANGVYWLDVLGRDGAGLRVRNCPERGRARLPQVEAVIEPGLVYPLVRWSDVRRWAAGPSGWIILAQDLTTRRGIDLATIKTQYPGTLRYLAQFEELLRARAAYRRYQGDAAFYSMYDVGPYTVAPHKVVWRRMDRRMEAAVVGEVDHPLLGRRPAVPQETCAFLAAGSADEAHYACAVLNSAVVDFLVRAHSVRGGKGFGTPSLLGVVRLVRYDPADPRHAELARMSRDAHAAAARGEDVEATQRAIDERAAALWQLTPAEGEAIRAELRG